MKTKTKKKSRTKTKRFAENKSCEMLGLWKIYKEKWLRCVNENATVKK